MFLVRTAYLAIVFALLAPAAKAGPISPYFVTAPDQDTNWVVQGPDVVNSWSQQNGNTQGESAIAVAGSVRTLGLGYPGSEYTLAGTYTGTDYAYPLPVVAFYDGASDGTYNYSVDYSETGGVYRFDGDWTNPVHLFDVGKGYVGIAYDTSDQTLWVSQYLGNAVEHWSLAGLYLGAFTAEHPSLTSLGLDPADGTLWIVSQSTQGTFYQYSKSGVLLSTETYAALTSQNIVGGEFAIPEPTTLLLLGLGLAALGAPRGRRRAGSRP